MASPLVLCVPRVPFSICDPDLKADFIEYNKSLSHCVTRYKNLIDEFFVKRNCWDQIKKISNDYELIFTQLYKHPCVARVKPPSRSYFKLWEILKLFEGRLLPYLSNGVKSAHVCEGPGGFIDCMIDWSARYAPDAPTEMHGMTLLSNDRVVPSWNLRQAKMARGNVHLHGGADGTGDVYNIDNIDHFIDSLGGDGTCDLVTGDGGFDVKINFNQVESILERLLVSEVYIAIRACKVGGAFIIKIFDSFTDVTMHLLWLIRTLFVDMYIVKPLTSRPANSERFVVAIGYKGCETVEASTQISAIRTYILSGGQQSLHPHAPADFIALISSFNTTYAFKQADQILKTLEYIEQIYVQKNKGHLQYMLSKQYSLCKEWCIAHDLEWCVNKTLAMSSNLDDL
jgi:hypothetical protein